MKKLSLSNAEVLQLDQELNGFFDQVARKQVNGLLSEPLPIKTKYWLERINSQITARKASIEKLRNEIVEKLGEEIDGVKQIPLTIEEGKGKDKKIVQNPKIKEFTEEFGKVLDEVEDLDIPTLTIDDLGTASTEVRLNVFMKLVEEQE